MNKEFICGSKQATFGGVVIECGIEHQCDSCCRKERDSLAAKIETMIDVAMRNGASKGVRDAIDKTPNACLDQVKAEAIGTAMQSIDMENFKMNGKVDPVVLRYMSELGRYADFLFNGSK